MGGLLNDKDRYHSLLVEHCSVCRRMVRGGSPWAAVEEDHNNCHGWYHCDPDCCGGCPTCEDADLLIHEALAQWESAIGERGSVESP